MQTPIRQYTLADRFIQQIDACLQALNSERPAGRIYPAKEIPEPTLTSQQRQQSAGFMRVNHSGEICAQALYNAQALVTRTPSVRQSFEFSAHEETDHLAWCHQRLQELNSHRSYFNIFWYWNSFFIGMMAGLAGDKWSLGFVEETEIQVGRHLQGHLDRLQQSDSKSRAIITQMQLDETKHAEKAQQQGATPLPTPIKKLMSWHAKIMTTMSYWI